MEQVVIDSSSIQIIELLGAGGYGEIFEAIVNGNKVAVKNIIKPSSKSYPGLYELGELIYLRRLNHPNILHCNHFSISDTNSLQFIFPIAEKDMLTMLTYGSPFSSETLRTWIYQLISAVYFLHKSGHYHCDIKPANILFFNGNACLADLGLVNKISIHSQDCQSLKSPQLQAKDNTRANQVLIKKFPILGKPSSNTQDDVWALGIVIYILITYKSGGMKLKFYDVAQSFLSDPRKFLEQEFIEKGIDIRYIPLLVRLLNPDPEQRGFNLIETLEMFPIANTDTLTLVPGTVIDPINNNPVVHFPQSFVRVLDMYLRIYLNFNMIDSIFFNSVDLFYRIYHLIKESDEVEVNNYAVACFLISLKICGEYDKLDEYLNGLLVQFSPSNKEDVLRAEINIVKDLEGILVRTLVSDYLNNHEECKIGASWIVDNPEKYEQLTPELLAISIRNLI